MIDKKLNKDLIAYLYPVGYILTTTNSQNPVEYLGVGTWDLLEPVNSTIFLTGTLSLSTGNSGTNQTCYFSTVTTNTGSDLTLTQSSVDGDTITINKAGTYIVTASGGRSANNSGFTIVKNGVRTTEGIFQSVDKKILEFFVANAASATYNYYHALISNTVYLEVGDALQYYRITTLASNYTPSFKVTSYNVDKYVWNRTA